jgi:8-oxo-dGTP diphosphatase
MKIPKGLFPLVREVARHVIRRPVCGVAALATNPRGEVVMIRRGDTGMWALPGGTLEWGETLGRCIERELEEEAGVLLQSTPKLVGVYSKPTRDPRFHAVTTLVRVDVGEILKAPMNPLEILEVRAFPQEQLPRELSHGMADMLSRLSRANTEVVFE